jgi:hypothetical protein
VNAPLAAIGTLLLCSACLRVSWERKLHDLPLRPEEYQELQPGAATLGDVLSKLGAPLEVWELGQGRFALAYGWEQNRELGLSVSLPVTQRQSANFDYDEINLHTYGIVCFLSADLRLESLEEGRLHEMRAAQRRRPECEEN